MTMLAPRLRGYYAILDVVGEAAPADEALGAWAGELLAAGPCCLQLRGKRLSVAAQQAVALTLGGLCRAAGVPLCVNDRLDVALAVGADGVHLGQDDLPLADARRLARGRLFIGVSTHDVGQARAAVAAGADYIGLGPIFGTRTKHSPDPVVGLEVLRQVAAEVHVPVVAIGGITLETVDEVAAAGATAVAVIAEIEKAENRTAAGRRIGQAFKEQVT